MEFEKPNLKRNVPEESDVSEESDGDDCELRKRMKIQIEPCFLPNDVKLVVEDQHLHVNRDLLASASPDFAAWLKDEWQDHQQADTTLRFTGKTYHDMSIFMKCLLPSFPKQVTSNYR
ncbi:uncharacterized protein LOC110443538 [Mizuhopecten yessoensis]|uniref:BTB domain-containing protein n=1 Tax=Mizuhopecten yessoensis TaxID=6573 RepID=A0A210PEM0_MIZYE|nr:uncharacterized protein LOC110443538 [Mizuhopecten yessoensis]OWF34933.1 hypothetical protein KP79_PYT23523 [Mizuhopecten yessoensis]